MPRASRRECCRRAATDQVCRTPHPPASYLWQVSNALDAGATPNEILGVMRAVAPQVGGPRVVAAAPEIMVALGLSLPPGGDFD